MIKKKIILLPLLSFVGIFPAICLPNQTNYFYKTTPDKPNNPNNEKKELNGEFSFDNKTFSINWKESKDTSIYKKIDVTVTLKVATPPTPTPPSSNTTPKANISTLTQSDANEIPSTLALIFETKINNNNTDEIVKYLKVSENREDKTKLVYSITVFRHADKPINLITKNKSNSAEIKPTVKNFNQQADSSILITKPFSETLDMKLQIRKPTDTDEFKEKFIYADIKPKTGINLESGIEELVLFKFYYMDNNNEVVLVDRTERNTSPLPLLNKSVTVMCNITFNYNDKINSDKIYETTLSIKIPPYVNNRTIVNVLQNNKSIIYFDSSKYIFEENSTTYEWFYENQPNSWAKIDNETNTYIDVSNKENLFNKQIKLKITYKNNKVSQFADNNNNNNVVNFDSIVWETQPTVCIAPTNQLFQEKMTISDLPENKKSFNLEFNELTSIDSVRWFLKENNNTLVEFQSLKGLKNVSIEQKEVEQNIVAIIDFGSNIYKEVSNIIPKGFSQNFNATISGGNDMSLVIENLNNSQGFVQAWIEKKTKNEWIKINDIDPSNNKQNFQLSDFSWYRIAFSNPNNKYPIYSNELYFVSNKTNILLISGIAVLIIIVIAAIATCILLFMKHNRNKLKNNTNSADVQQENSVDDKKE